MTLSAPIRFRECRAISVLPSPGAGEQILRRLESDLLVELVARVSVLDDRAQQTLGIVESADGVEAERAFSRKNSRGAGPTSAGPEILGGHHEPPRSIEPDSPARCDVVVKRRSAIMPTSWAQRFETAPTNVADRRCPAADIGGSGMARVIENCRRLRVRTPI